MIINVFGLFLHAFRAKLELISTKPSAYYVAHKLYVYCHTELIFVALLTLWVMARLRDLLVRFSASFQLAIS